MQVQSLCQGEPLEEGKETCSSVLAWRIPWTKEPGRLQSIVLHTVRDNLSDLVCTHLSGAFLDKNGRLSKADCFPDCAWRTTDWGLKHCTGGSDQNHPQEKAMRKGKVALWGDLTNSWEDKRSKRQGRKGKIYPPKPRVPKNSKER